MCYLFLCKDADGFGVDNLESAGTRGRTSGTDHFTVNPDLHQIPDDNCPINCENCGACPRPFDESPSLFSPVYMDYQRQVTKMAGGDHPRRKLVDKNWRIAIIMEYIHDLSRQQIIGNLPNDHAVDTDANDWRHRCVEAMAEDMEFIGMTYANHEPEANFFTRVNQRFLQQQTEHSVYNDSYCCEECSLYLGHPNHLPPCDYQPQTVNFNKCRHCGEGPNHDSHKPECRAHILAPMMKRMFINPRRLCFRCNKAYANCNCPTTFEGIGFFPHEMDVGSEEHIDSPWDSIFLNQIQQIPYSAYNFGMCAMIGRTITEKVGSGADEIQGCNLLYGAKQTGKSLTLKNLQRWFPPSQQGDIPDSAEEQ